MIARALKLESKSVAAADDGVTEDAIDATVAAHDLPFADIVEDAWYYSEVRAAYEAGIINGISATEFAPHALISREQMAIMIVNAYLYKIDSTVDQLITNSFITFEDDEQICVWAKPYVTVAANVE